MRLQQHAGNRAVGRALAGRAAPTAVLQRAPAKGTAADPSEAAAKSTGGAQDAWDAIVQARLEAFLHEFQNIPVEVTWQEGGEVKTATVHVHPPYFINTERYAKSKKRLEAARKHRKAATESTEKAPVEASWAALHGKSSPDEIREVLEKALAKGVIATPEGKKHPDADDLRAWLVKYGIGVDCSGFVYQALTEVMAEAQAKVGMQGPVEKIVGKTVTNVPASGLKGGAEGFAKVGSPEELRSGDTMHTPGHIRIVMGVKKSDGAVVFTTAESTSAKGDIGPNRAAWRYDDAAKFEGLLRKSGEKWSKYGKSPTYGRYKALAAFTSEPVPAGVEGAERSPEKPLAPEEKGLLESSEEGAKALASGILKGITAASEGVKGMIRDFVKWLHEAKRAPARGGAGEAESPVIARTERGKAVLALAIHRGERDEIKLTDLVFHLRHPERGGEAVGKGEEALAKEWLTIRSGEVRPALSKAK